MRTRYSIILPIAAILSGVVLELGSLGLIGNHLPKNVLINLWPAILIFVGFDLLFTQRRLIGAMVLLFTGAAILSTQFLDGGVNNEVWQFFLKVWPLLLILFGIVFVFMGLIGEYVGRIYISLNRAPQFVIKDMRKSGETK